jgi:hypothetical protein
VVVTFQYHASNVFSTGASKLSRRVEERATEALTGFVLRVAELMVKANPSKKRGTTELGGTKFTARYLVSARYDQGDA